MIPYIVLLLLQNHQGEWNDLPHSVDDHLQRGRTPAIPLASLNIDFLVLIVGRSEAAAFGIGSVRQGGLSFGLDGAIG